MPPVFGIIRRTTMTPVTLFLSNGHPLLVQAVDSFQNLLVRQEVFNGFVAVPPAGEILLAKEGRAGVRRSELAPILRKTSGYSVIVTSACCRPSAPPHHGLEALQRKISLPLARRPGRALLLQVLTASGRSAAFQTLRRAPGPTQRSWQHLKHRPTLPKLSFLFRQLIVIWMSLRSSNATALCAFTNTWEKVQL